MTHGHEQWCGGRLWEWGRWLEGGGQKGEIWDNTNSINNKKYLTFKKRSRGISLFCRNPVPYIKNAYYSWFL